MNLRNFKTRNFNTSENRIFSSGLTLIEVALAIIISAMITIGIIQAIGSATKRMHESAEANYINILARAMNDYVEVNAATITMAADSDKPAVAFLNGFVPENMNVTSPNNLTYNTSFILPPAHTTQTSQNVQAFLVANTNAKNWTAEELASIALLSAPSAGYRSDIMNANNIISPGGWTVPKNSFPANGIPANNSLVIYANMLTGGISGGNWLARNPDGAIGANGIRAAGPQNTMNTDILMNGNNASYSIFNARSLSLTSGDPAIAGVLSQSDTNIGLTGQTSSFCFLNTKPTLSGVALTNNELNCDQGNAAVVDNIFFDTRGIRIVNHGIGFTLGGMTSITVGMGDVNAVLNDGLGAGNNAPGVWVDLSTFSHIRQYLHLRNAGVTLGYVSSLPGTVSSMLVFDDTASKTSLTAGTMLFESKNDDHPGTNISQASLVLQADVGSVGIWSENAKILEEGANGIDLTSDNASGPIKISGAPLEVHKGIAMKALTGEYAGITGVRYITSSSQDPFLSYPSNKPVIDFVPHINYSHNPKGVYIYNDDLILPSSNLLVNNGNIHFGATNPVYSVIDGVHTIVFSNVNSCLGITTHNAYICSSSTHNGELVINSGMNENFLLEAGQGWIDIGTNIELGNLDVEIDKDLTVDGTINYGQLHQTSDRRLKKDIVPLNDMLQVLNKIHGYSFRWKKNNKKDVGVIAQEVQKVFPGFVGSTKIDKKSYLTVSYVSFIAPIISAIQELYHKFLTFVDQVDARFHTEDLKIKTLQSKVNKLQKSNENNVYFHTNEDLKIKKLIDEVNKLQKSNKALEIKVSNMKIQHIR